MNNQLCDFLMKNTFTAGSKWRHLVISENQSLCLSIIASFAMSACIKYVPNSLIKASTSKLLKTNTRCFLFIKFDLFSQICVCMFLQNLFICMCVYSLHAAVSLTVECGLCMCVLTAFLVSLGVILKCGGEAL